MTEVAGHASSVGDSPDHVRLSRIEVDMEAGAPGEAPERRHPSTHRLCGGKQIQHLPETTAGAPVVVKGLLVGRAGPRRTRMRAGYLRASCRPYGNGLGLTRSQRRRHRTPREAA